MENKCSPPNKSIALEENPARGKIISHHLETTISGKRESHNLCILCFKTEEVLLKFLHTE